MRVSILHLALGLSLAASVSSAGAQSTACQVSVHVDGFRNTKGDLGVSVFRTPDGWPENNDKAVFHSGFPIQGDHTTAEFTLPEGRFAIVVLHDENTNHKLDRNFIGIPREGFGFANNPRVGLSAPSFEAAILPVACPRTETSIHLIYK